MRGLGKLGIKNGALTWRRGILLGILVVMALAVGYKAQRVWRLAQSLQDRLDLLEAAAADNGVADLGKVGENLEGAYADLEMLRTELDVLIPLSSRLEWVPVVGGDLAAAPALMDMALSVAEAGTIAFEGLEPLVESIESDGVEDQLLTQVANIMSQADTDLDAAQDVLGAGLRRRSEIDVSALSGRTAGLLAKFDRYVPLLQVALDGGRLFPELLGASGPRTYFVLVQNDDELRATGGFISAVGLLRLVDGVIEEFVFEDSYAVDDFSHPYPDSPSPFVRYMGIDLWVFRDANWSPDFATSAQQAIELYRISRDLDVDGVLAVDQHALKEIVTVLAPLEVEGWPEPVTGKNVISMIRSAWSSPEDFSQTDANWWRDRKRFMSDLFNALQAKVLEAPEQVNWLSLARSVFDLLDERHLQIWLADPTEETTELLSQRGWKSVVRDASGDYLMVVDTNMGFNKANAQVEESLDYRVLISVDGTAQATLTVRHANGGSAEVNCDPRPHYGADYGDLVDRCYWNYLRVYAPSGSQLAAVTPHPVSANWLVTGKGQSGTGEMLPEEQGKAVFASFFVLPTAEATETRFVYRLPQGTLKRTDNGWRYRLLVQKQAGTGAVPLRVTLALPPGSEVQVANFPDLDQDGSRVEQPEPSTVVLDTDLERDRIFEVLFQFPDDDGGDTPR
jgi:hypothetical protein